MRRVEKRIPFNLPCLTGNEMNYLQECIHLMKFSGDGSFTKRASRRLEDLIESKNILLTTSCTDALEMCALLLDISPGDEVIIPSFTFVSTANAFVLRGAKIVFVDIDPNTMNVDAKKVEEAITPKTKAIVIVHYAGVSCDMDTFMSLRERYKIPIVEDAAQAVLAKHKNQYLGTMGDLGCFSFHETKNINCGEGGALSVNNNAFFERAEILREKGTNRSRFHRGQVDKYTWMDLGSSFLMNELSAAFLLAQLEQAKEITKKRCEIWNKYQRALLPLEKSGFIELQQVPSYAAINGHLFYMKLKNESIRAKFIAHMEKANVATVFHYIPLHSAPAGIRFSRFHGVDRFTTTHSERLVRLPIYSAMTHEEQDFVIAETIDFLKAES